MNFREPDRLNAPVYNAILEAGITGRGKLPSDADRAHPARKTTTNALAMDARETTAQERRPANGVDRA